MLRLKTIHDNLILQVRSLIGSELSLITDVSSGLTYRAVIKDTALATNGDTSTMPNYPYVVIDLLTSGKRILTGEGVTTTELSYIKTLRNPIFKLTCYGGACLDILDKFNAYLEMSRIRVYFCDALNNSIEPYIKKQSSVAILKISDIKEMPVFVETSFINSAEMEITLSVESYLVDFDSSLIEEIEGSLVFKDTEEGIDIVTIPISEIIPP